jgi:hypothetical protein
MTKPRLWVDFNNADVQGRVRLDCRGTMRDLERKGIELKEGMILTLFCEDSDDDGRPADMVVDGTIAWSPDEHMWVAAIDWDAIQHVPPAPAAASNGTPSAQPTLKEPARF